MAELKTQKNDQSVEDFVNSVQDEGKRQDCWTVLEMMERLTHEKPAMWGSSIVGFGVYHYKGASGREGDWFVIGFSPRKQALTLYFSFGFDRVSGLLDNLGKYKTGVGCLYIKRLTDIDLGTLEQLIQATVERSQKK
jgi:hypothetical protein